MSALPKPRMTAAEYLEFERAAKSRHEFYAGEIFAMAGASADHNRIARNLTARLDAALRDKDCEVFQSDMRVKVSETGLYTYPDVVVVCGKARFEDAQVDTLLNPRVVFEVLSESTEAYDRGAKLRQYMSLGSLATYVLVAQDECRVEVFDRREDSQWLFRLLQDMDDVLELDAIGCRLPLRDVFRRVSFADVSSESTDES